MTTEQEFVEIVILAEDRATEELKRTEQQVRKNAEAVKATGENAKRSTELVGSLASAMGGSEIGSFAGQVAMLTERVGQFSDVAKGGGIAVLGLKAGAAAAAGVIAFQLGRSIGDIIFQTRHWREELERQEAVTERLIQKSIQLHTGRFQREQNQVASVEDPASQAAGFEDLIDRISQDIEGVGGLNEQLSELKKRRAGAFTALAVGSLGGFGLGGQIKELEDRKAALNDIIQQTRELAKARQEERAAQATAEKKAEVEASREYVESLRLQVQLLEASGDERNKIIAAQRTVSQDGRQIHRLEAEALLNQLDRIKEKQKAEQDAATKAAQAARELEATKKREKEQLLNVQLRTLETAELEALALAKGMEAVRARRLEQQGLSEEQAQQYSDLQSQLERIRQQSSIAPQLTSSEDRFTRGLAASSRNDRLVEVAQRGEAQREEANRILTKIEGLLEQIKDNGGDFQFQEVG